MDVTIAIRGAYQTGHAYLTWLVDDRPTATWAFDVELD